MPPFYRASWYGEVVVLDRVTAMKYLYAVIVAIVGFAAVGHYDAGVIPTLAAFVAPVLVLKYGPKP